MRFLRAALARPSHAYLFVGMPHVGKTTAALAFAQALNCTCAADAPLAACPDCLKRGEASIAETRSMLETLLHGACAECRSIAHSNHPDVRFVRATDGKQVVSVEDVRKLVEEASWKPFRARHKVYVIANELLNVQGANTLLKTIEEPHPGTVIVLTASSLDEVLPTLVSRCQPVFFAPVATETIAGWLQAAHGVLPDAAYHLARVSDGRIGWAATLAATAELPEPRLLLVDGLPAALTEAARLAQEDAETQQLALEALIAQLRDIMIWRETGRTGWIARPDQAQAAAQKGLPLAYYLRVIQRLETARKQLLGHANAKLLWTVLASDVQPTAKELEQALGA